MKRYIREYIKIRPHSSFDAGQLLVRQGSQISANVTECVSYADAYNDPFKIKVWPLKLT